MTYYACVEDGVLVGVMGEEPNTPDTVAVVEISEEDYYKLSVGTGVFCIESMSVIDCPEAPTDQDHLRFLSDSDWVVLRHMREKYLGLATSLSEDEFFELETKRHLAAKSITR